MKKVTYAAYGYIDWIARIPIGKACLTVEFSGGALSKFGTTPAEFTTTDPFTQQAIESSEYFRSGKIKLLRSSEISAPAPTASTKPCADEEATLTLDDAIFMLNSRFSIPTCRIRTPEAAVAIAANHGIHLKIIDR